MSMSLKEKFETYGTPAGSTWRDKPNNLIRSCLAEFIGDLIFVFVGSMSFQATGNIVAFAFAHGLTIFILINHFGHISGGHYNPAVTMGVLMSGHIHPIHAVLYWISQLLGGFVGGLFVRAVLHETVYSQISGGTTNMNLASSSEGQAFITEAILTYVLVNSVLMTAVDTNTNVLAPFAIGLSVSVGVFAGGNSSGGSMNTARSFGAAAAYGIFGKSCAKGVSCIVADTVWRYHWIHWLGPFTGATIAGGVYRLFFGKDRMLLRG